MDDAETVDENLMILKVIVLTTLHLPQSDFMKRTDRRRNQSSPSLSEDM